MPRSVAAVLAHADELAARLENYQPDPADELSAVELELRRATLAQDTNFDG